MKINELVEKYTYRVEWSEEDSSHIAKCIEFPSLTAHGKKSKDALSEIEKVVFSSLSWMMENGEEIPEPLSVKQFKGHLSLRVTPEIHRSLALKSAEEGVSINKYIMSRLG